MVDRTPAYALLAGFLDYPDEKYRDRVESYTGILESGGGTVAQLTSDFRAAVCGMPIEEIQELYTRTFDINPLCTLEVGWHVYGEDYARGEFLVKMRQLLKEHNLPESKELPDHLTHVLAILAQLDGEEADFLASRYLLPALGKMLEGFQNEGNPYMKVLEAIVASVKSHHDVEAVLPRGRRGDPPGSTHRLPIVGNLGDRR
jgi:nitrate reductase delta subunit